MLSLKLVAFNTTLIALAAKQAFWKLAVIKPIPADNIFSTHLIFDVNGRCTEHVLYWSFITP